MKTSWENADLAAREKEIFASIMARNPEHDFEPTLDRVRRAMEYLGDPQNAYRVVHVTGTNGKTSTSRMVTALIGEHGLRTGLFTSPHLTTVRERIQIDGEPISLADFVELWDELEPILGLVDQESLAQGGPRLSFFEVLTVLALAAFAAAPVDVAIIEVGMGGTWDATNVVAADVAIITPIAVDHQEWLGSTIADIAAEKSGIIKESSIAVIAQQADSATEVLTRAAESARGSYWEGLDFEITDRAPGVGGQLLSMRTPGASYSELFVPLYGQHQGQNAALALTAVEVLLADGGAPTALAGSTVEAGFAAASSPGRLEVVRSSPLIMVDAAHNPHGVAAVGTALAESFAFSSLIGVVGVLADKDAAGIMAELETYLDGLVVTESLSPRAIPAPELAEIAIEVFGAERVRLAPNLPEAIDMAVQWSEADSELGAGVLILGSITVIAEARILLRADGATSAPPVPLPLPRESHE